MRKRPARGRNLIVCDCKPQGYGVLVKQEGTEQERQVLDGGYIWQILGEIKLHLDRSLDVKIVGGRCKNCGKTFAIAFNSERHYIGDQFEFAADIWYAIRNDPSVLVLSPQLRIVPPTSEQ